MQLARQPAVPEQPRQLALQATADSGHFSRSDFAVDHQALLAEAGQSNLTVNFYYPTEVTRPYMPNPTNIFTAVQENLRQAGITVNAVPQPWNGGYLDSVSVNGVHDLHLLGWTGDYNDAGNFIGTFFGRNKPEFGFNDPNLFQEITAAGMTLVDVVEPEWPADLTRTWGAWSPLRGQLIPGTAIFVCERPA